MELRDTLSALTEQAEQGQSLEVPKEPVEPVKPVKPLEQPVEPVGGRTAGRERDEKGRLLPTEIAPVPAEKIDRPSSWKKEMWGHWDKVVLENPDLAKYINQREGEYAKGVSIYKTEWDQAKPLLDAIAPYQQDFQKLGFQPAQAISKLAQTHREMVSSTPGQRLQIFAKLAQDYQVPLQALYDPQFAQQFAMQQPAQQQVPVEKLVEQKMGEWMSQQAVTSFQSARDQNGNPLYPHFEAVRPKMGQLLEAGLAETLEDAYAKSVKLDDELFASEQETKRQADEAKRLEEQRKTVQAAKGNAISPKSATPASVGASAKKGLRATLEHAFDEHTAGRV